MPSARWNGHALIGTLAVDGRQISVAVDRKTIHRCAAGSNDAITWELERYSEEIFAKLKPYLLAKHAQPSA